ncbi:MAG TPA: hypothetical protein VGN86_17335 [Pyrinomonadaceae bacterium]|jgi:hypothetical protein|nr:hypothetical protein [Pyrinomonadaceae bacterium]
MIALAVILILLAILTLIHFVYEGILAPSFRARLRLNLFSLRDKLRKLKMERREELSDEVFLDLQASINFAATRLSKVDLVLLMNARRAFEQDEHLRKRAEHRNALFEACPIEELHTIRHEYFDILDDALAINSGGWMPYLIPILVGLLLKESANGLIKKVFSLSDKDIDRIAPPDLLLAS